MTAGREDDEALDRTGGATLCEARLAVEEARAGKAHQIAALERAVADLFAAAELTSTDDEHDPEGPTIAYERAQLLALLRQARHDLDLLGAAARRLAGADGLACARCGAPIGTERLAALPTTDRCVRCAAR